LREVSGPVADEARHTLGRGDEWAAAPAARMAFAVGSKSVMRAQACKPRRIGGIATAGRALGAVRGRTRSRGLAGPKTLPPPPPPPKLTASHQPSHRSPGKKYICLPIASLSALTLPTLSAHLRLVSVYSTCAICLRRFAHCPHCRGLASSVAHSPLSPPNLQKPSPPTPRPPPPPPPPSQSANAAANLELAICTCSLFHCALRRTAEHSHPLHRCLLPNAAHHISAHPHTAYLQSKTPGLVLTLSSLVSGPW